MYKLTTKIGLLKRVRRKPELAACAMAALFFLAALAAPAQAQNTYGGSTVVYGGTIGLVPEQRMSISVPNFYFAADGSVRFFKSSALKVYDREGHAVTERESGLVYSGESGGMNELGDIFTLSYRDLPVQGEPRTGRKEVWIEVHSISFSATQERTEDISAVVLPPTVELIDDLTGRTVIFATLLSGLTQAQLDSFNAFEGFRGGISVGAAAGQTIQIQFLSADPADSSLDNPSGEPGVITGSATSAAHVKVFNASTGALLWSRELTSLPPGLHTFDINRDELRETGNPGTGRIQLWIEVVLDGMKVSLPTFEVFDNGSGKTTVRGDMWGPMKESMETMKKAWRGAS